MKILLIIFIILCIAQIICQIMIIKINNEQIKNYKKILKNNKEIKSFAELHELAKISIKK